MRTGSPERLFHCSGHWHFLLVVAFLPEGLVLRLCFTFSFAHLDPESLIQTFLFPVQFMALFLLMIRPQNQLFCWWRCPQLILACLVFQEVRLSPPAPFSCHPWLKFIRAAAGRKFASFTKTYSSASYFYCFNIFQWWGWETKPASSLESSVNLWSACFIHHWLLRLLVTCKGICFQSNLKFVLVFKHTRTTWSFKGFRCLQLHEVLFVLK